MFPSDPCVIELERNTKHADGITAPGPFNRPIEDPSLPCQMSNGVRPSLNPRVTSKAGPPRSWQQARLVTA